MGDDDTEDRLIAANTLCQSYRASRFEVIADDSLGFLELLLAVKNQFGKQVPDNEIKNLLPA
jgi:hypothetical protein